MNWINIATTTLNSEAFVGADPTDRATWLCLLGYCCEQENGGIINDCREWKDRKWQQLVRVTAKEVTRGCDLWRWEGGDLIVEFYPLDQQEEVQRKRNTARTNGGKGGRPPKTPAETNEETNVGYSSVPDDNPDRKRNSKGIGKEVPPNPQGGMGEEDSNRVLPKNWKRIPLRTQKVTRCFRNSPAMERIGKWFNRGKDTIWTVHEAGLLQQLAPPLTEIDLLEEYYLSFIDPEKDHRRKSLATLLNNWSGELDRARIWKADNS